MGPASTDGEEAADAAVTDGGNPPLDRGALLAAGASCRRRARMLRETGAHRAAIEELGGIVPLRAAYVATLSDVMVARCPFTDVPVRFPLDTIGLDGWYWDYETPARRIPDDLPPTWVAMTGGLRLATVPPDAPFLRRPGPPVPFVVPELLLAGLVAVVAEVRVGADLGWAITYFAAPRATVPDRVVNLWGHDSHPVRTAAGWRIDTSPRRASDFDGDLRPWLASGHLRWIAPGDATHALRTDQDCPFLDLPRDATDWPVLDATD